MLDNDPPPGTPIVFVRLTKGIAANSTATLVKAEKKYLTESAEDRFTVRLPNGVLVDVERRDIRKA